MNFNETINTFNTFQADTDSYQRLKEFLWNELGDFGFSIPVKVKDVKTLDKQDLTKDDNKDNKEAYISCIPQIQMRDADGNNISHKTLFNIPLSRVQGGKNGIICEPCKDDIGFICVCGRDISRYKRIQKESAPPTYQRWSFADSFYVGKMFQKEMESFIKFFHEKGHIRSWSKKGDISQLTDEKDISSEAKKGNITLIADEKDISLKASKGKIAITANNCEISVQGEVKIKAQDVKVDSNVDVTGDVKAGGISLRNHRHNYSWTREAGDSITNKPL